MDLAQRRLLTVHKQKSHCEALDALYAILTGSCDPPKTLQNITELLLKKKLFKTYLMKRYQYLGRRRGQLPCTYVTYKQTLLDRRAELKNEEKRVRFLACILQQNTG